MVMLAEALAPEEQRINGAQAVSDYSQQKKMSVSPPRHRLNVNLPRRESKEEFPDDLTQSRKAAKAQKAEYQLSAFVLSRVFASSRLRAFALKVFSQRKDAKRIVMKQTILPGSLWKREWPPPLVVS
jgi:hypothetical protein